MRALVVTVAVLGAVGVLGTAWFFYYYGYAVRHNSDAAALQRDLEALPGVVSARVEYSKDWLDLEPNMDDDGINASMDTGVVLEPTASPAMLAAVLLAVNKTVRRHDDWRFLESVRIGDDTLLGGVGDPKMAYESAKLRAAVDLFGRVRELGTVRASLLPTFDVTVELPRGTTAADLRPAYDTLARLSRSSAPLIPLRVGDVTAGDGSGFSDGVPSAAQWAEQQRLLEIRLPGADLGVHLRAVGSEDLVINPRSTTASLDNPLFRARLGAAVRGEVTEYLNRTGGSPGISVWIDDRLVALVDRSRCHRGLTSWDDELNHWYWKVDCSRTGAEPPDPRLLEWRSRLLESRHD